VKSPFAPVVLPLAALIASLVRWWLQGSGNMYTALDKRLYVPDPDLGWRIADEHPIWLGLEVCAIIAGIAVGCAIGGFIIRRLTASRPRIAKGLRIAAWIGGGLTLGVPIAAFASGAGIDGARDTLPTATRNVAEGIRGSLELPGGHYAVVAHAGTAISAHITAGGETFDARFASDVTGGWNGEPRDLTKPMTAAISVGAKVVDTGVTPRSNSARDYLQVDKHPRITFTLDKLAAASQESPAQIAFRAQGTLGFIGKTHIVDVIGTLSKPDNAGLARLGLQGTIMLAQADFSIVIKETALAPDAGDFDGDRIPIHVSLVLKETPK
jgi:polyisoprenoid-binding protein YceI